MIRKYRHIILFFAAVVFFTLSYFSYKYFERASQYVLDTNKIEKKIQENDTELINILQYYKKQLEGKANILKSRNSPFYFSTLKTTYKKNFTVLIYENDTLKFWTDNFFPAPFLFSESNFEDKEVVNAPNGWYRLKIIRTNDFEITGLYCIKKNFFYENKYLKSSFTIGLNLPSSAVVSTSPISIGKNIKDSEGNYLFSLIPSNNIISNNTDYNIPFFLFVISLILLLSATAELLKKTYKNYIFSSILWLSVFILFYFILKLDLPPFLNGGEFYSGEIYSGNFPFGNIADIIIVSVFYIFTAANLFNVIPLENIFEKISEKRPLFLYILFITALFAAALLFINTSSLLKDIILSSEIQFDIRKIINPDINFAAVLVSTSALYLSVFYFADSVIRLSLKLISFLNLFVLIVFTTILLSFFDLIFFGFHFYEISFFGAIILIILIVRKHKDSYSYFSVLAIIFIFTLFSSLFTDKYNRQKEKVNRKELIKKLTNDRDPIAESFLREINLRLYNDTVLINKIKDVSENQDLEIFEYLKRKYFYGFWEKYDLEISLCGNTEFYPEENQAENCRGFYRNELLKFGEKAENTNFWLMHYNTGKITYFGIVDVPVENDEREMSLYITLSEKLTAKTLGYPALLIDKSTKTKDEFSGYSYAKYSKGILAVKFGNFPYELKDDKFRKNINSVEYETESDNYRHLVYVGNKEKIIVLSKEKKTFFDNVISFVYLFFIYNVLVFIAVLFYDYKYLLRSFRFDFKNKIRFSMIFILLVSFILFGAGTIYFTVRQNKKVNEREMKEKVQSVLTELKHKLQYEEELTPDWHTKQYDHLDELLNKFSQVFFSDINLYDLNGKLLATSRSEIFNRGLIGKQMNPEAFRMLVSEGKTEYIQKESIGKMEFLSIYIPLRNENNKIIAFINLPYFSNNNSVRKNITDILIATVNLYLVLFLLTAFLSVLLSSQITKPLTLLQDKLKDVQIGKKHKQIIYTKKDEIGTLVKEYNIMLAKLEDSAHKLAESERESAWREMAKQIAHEIKNPLTPMKLSIQLLQKTWFDKATEKEEFERRLNTVTQTLIEQINTLSSIASEFSAFAKMPKARKEEVEIVRKLKNVTSLFENEQNIEINLILNGIPELYVIADKEQVSRVFINLIKNAIQAIPKGRKGKITVKLEESENRAKITVEDNGEGISEEQKKHLFEPNFTTKTTGTGIGLAIVKNIVTTAGGSIKVESKKNTGTKFIIEFLKIQATFV